MMNKIILIGRLVRDPELRYTSNGTAVGDFTLAVERDYSSQSGEKKVDYIKVVVWRKSAENVAKFLGKGRLVAVEGSLYINKSQDKDGRNYNTPEVNAAQVQFLDWPSEVKAGTDMNDTSKDVELADNELNDIIY